jgi:hypothetical protein
MQSLRDWSDQGRRPKGQRGFCMLLNGFWILVGLVGILRVGNILHWERGLREAENPEAVTLVDFARPTILKGLDHSAQRCEERATLGKNQPQSLP